MFDNERHSVILLALGAATGLALATSGLLVSHMGPALPDDAAARVNTRLISNEAYARALRRFGSDSREAISEQDSRWVLDRLIEEELLVQRGIAIGLSDTSQTVRSALVQSLLDSVKARAESHDADPAELRDWYRDHLTLFAGQPRYRVRVRAYATQSDARAAADQDETGHEVTVPDTLLSPGKLRDYLGASAADAIVTLDSGDTETVRSNGAWLRLRIVEREPGGPPDFESNKENIEREWRRQRADEALRDYLTQLQNDAEIVRRDAPAQ